MPVRCFAAYFVGISVCSTIAFAACAAGHPVPQNAEVPLDAPAAVTLHTPARPGVQPARQAHRTVLVATAE